MDVAYDDFEGKLLNIAWAVAQYQANGFNAGGQTSLRMLEGTGWTVRRPAVDKPLVSAAGVQQVLPYLRERASSWGTVQAVGRALKSSGARRIATSPTERIYTDLVTTWPEPIPALPF